MDNHYDAIVIGSGIGGLTVAAMLSRYNRKRVLVLEQHFTAGGLTHCFKRKSVYLFDVGLHYIGQLQPGTMQRAILDYLTGGGLQWTPMPHVFDCFVYPDIEFHVPADPAEYRRALQERFPAEAAAIAAYFADIESTAAWYTMAHMTETFPWLARKGFDLALALLGGRARMTTKAYFDSRFRDDKLKALLASQWGNYGLPPSQSCFGIHALIVAHYFKGAAYPVGGARRIFSAILPAIEANGGEVLTRSRVDEILVRDGRACGVRVSDPYKPDRPSREYRADVIVSDAGAKNTYLRMLPRDVPIPFRTALEAVKPGYSAVAVYVGFKESPAALGFKGENYWVYKGYDHDRLATEGAWGDFYYLSFASLKDPQARAHTAEIITFTTYEKFARWRGTDWRRRGPEYEAFKQRIADSLLSEVEKRFPGFRGLIDYMEVSTPLTVEKFQAGPAGAFYGLPAVPERIGKPWTRARTPVRNLYLTGTDTMSLGIVGAMMGGMKTAALLNGALGFPRLMSAVKRAARTNRS